MACQKLCKQVRNNIIVKVNIQSLIPASFSHQFALNRFEYDSHLIKIPSHLDRESIYRTYSNKTHAN